MSQNETLQKYTVVTRLFKDYPIDCHDLVGSVCRLTPWALIFEHHGTTSPPALKEIKGIAKLNTKTKIHVIAHSSRDFSIVLFRTQNNLNKVFSRANDFAPQYTARLIQKDEETAPERKFSASPKISELADLQCYLKAFFYKACNDEVDKLARERRMWREGPVPPADSPDPTAGKDKSSKSRRLRRKDHEHDAIERARRSFQAALRDGRGPLSNGFIPPLPVPNPPRPSNTRKRFRSPSPPPPPSNRPRTSIAPSFTYKQVIEQLPTAIFGRLLLQLANTAFRDALQVVLSGMPLLKELSNVERTEEASPSGSPSQGHRTRLVPGVALLEPGIADQYEDAICLHRAIDDPSDPRLVAYDTQVQDAITQALERIRRGE
ncbi:hypothetical protein FRC04_001109 [Tulasnella sp. 424]|nr:hypothetical protein FRC04_001109 [Tulasnella sp. 424]KAG8969344.1 hypothetical protein FRC05_001083 [Tulasnella sp. 425]